MTLAVGVDGGMGADDFCRSLSRRADAFDSEPQEPQKEQNPWVAVRVALRALDQDVTRATLTAQTVPWSGDAGTPGPGIATVSSQAASEVLGRAVESLLEPFRGLGGESSVAALEVTVRCALASPR
jgi:hypothetical protein